MNDPNKNQSQKRGVYPERSRRALKYALWLLGRRAKTQKEIEEKLIDKEYPQAEVDFVVKRLCEWKLLDDFEFAKNYIRQSKIIKPKGKYRLSQELFRKGVEKEVINSALEEEFGDEEEELVEKTLKSYWKKISRLPREKQYNRAMGYLLRRGFSVNKAKNAAKKFLTYETSSDNLDL